LDLGLFKNLVLGGYAAQTRTADFSGGQSNVGANLNFRSNWLDFQAEHRKIGPNFNPSVGFLERTDCICDYADATFKTARNFGVYESCNSRASSSMPGYPPCRSDAGMAKHFSCRLP
jgi:hypothetical protein